VIVNADDFGLDSSTNRGIVAAFERGFVSSTTLIVNQPGFDEAVELAHERGLEQHVGAHLVLTSGRPLTEPIRRLERFCDSEGVFRSWHSDTRVWRLSKHEREAALLELRAQVERIRASRLPVTHIDSHHHVHNDWAIGSCAIAVARSAAVPYMRLARNCGPNISAASSVYKRLFNFRLRRRGLARTRWFGDAGQWRHLRDRGTSKSSLDDFELMTHPSLDEHGRLVEALSADEELEATLASVDGIRAAVSYSGARYGSAS
jgi:chitin disaccharide deacetylase